MWNSITDKNYRYVKNEMVLRKKRPLSRRCHNFEKRHADFFQDYPNVIHFNLAHLCPSMLFFPFAVFVVLFNSFKWFLQCFILFFGHFGKKGKESNLSSV